MSSKTIFVFVLFFLFQLGFSQTQNIRSGIFQLCSLISGVVPVVSMLLVVSTGAIYAAGQFLGAETRARANVWATATLTGALVGILISVAGPAVIGVMYGQGWDASCAQAGQGGGDDEGNEIYCGGRGPYDGDAYHCCNDAGEEIACRQNQKCCNAEMGCKAQDYQCQGGGGEGGED